MNFSHVTLLHFLSYCRQLGHILIFDSVFGALLSGLVIVQTETRDDVRLALHALRLEVCHQLILVGVLGASNHHYGLEPHCERLFADVVYGQVLSVDLSSAFVQLALESGIKHLQDF